MAPVRRSPYPVGTPVTDLRLLQNRRTEILAALDAVAPDEAGSRHAVVLGEQRSGRSTVLNEVARRAAAERHRLVVTLRSGEDSMWGRHELIRRLLTAIVETLAEGTDARDADWYQAWRDRVYLRDCGPSGDRDILSSALVMAADSHAEIDRVILERDLRALREIARDKGLRGIVISIDDASPLTEDVALVEDLLTTLDVVGGYGLLLAGLPTTATHFMQAASPCLARFTPVWLRPFRGPHQVFTALNAPLSGSACEWVDAGDAAFLRDVLRLTGGNPYEVMLVGHHLWLTCERGEQDSYALTPRILDRVIPDLSLLASGGDALLHGAHAIDRLPEEHVRHAVELVALARLTVRQIAIARILKIDSRDADEADRAILSADIAEETNRVVSELEELEEAGVVQLHPNGDTFSVVGGQAASVLLKYKARAQIGAQASGQPFELGFLLAVGRALARDAAARTLAALNGAASLGFGAVLSFDGAGRLSPRPAVRHLSNPGGITRLVEAEVDLVPWDAETYKRIAELLTEDDPAVGLVYTALSHQGEQLEYVELWEVPDDVCQDQLARTWSEITEEQEWARMVTGADLGWDGSEFAVVRGETARQALIVLQRYAATSAVHMLFERWYVDGDRAALARATEIADEAVATMRATGLSEWELGGELSAMLSRAGFLKSFDDGLLEAARVALEDALRTGAADTWITRWNLANVAARQGDLATARGHLDEVATDLGEWSDTAFVLFFVPGRPARDSLVRVTEAGIALLLDLQRAILAVQQGESCELSAIAERCRRSQDADVRKAAAWVTDCFATTGS